MTERVRPLKPRQEPEQSNLPPPAARWLPAAVNGTLVAVVFSLPMPPALLAPVPILIAWRRYGRTLGLATAAVAVLSVALLQGAVALLSPASLGAAHSGPPGLMAFLVLVLGPSLLLGYGLERAESAARALVEVAGLYLALLAAGLVMVELLAAGESLLARVGEWVEEALDVAIATGRETARGNMDAMEAVGTLEARRHWYQRWAVRLMPSLAASGAVLSLWANVLYSRWFTGRKSEDDDLCNWQLPMWVTYLFMVCAAAVVLQVGPLAGLLPRWEPILIFAANGLVLLVTLYWLQGVAVANFYFFRLRVGPVTRMVGIGLQAVLMVRPVTSAMYAAAGMADAWFDLRRLAAPMDDDNGEER